MDSYKKSVYAGVLGKIIGVYFGRPVEGWSREQIRERFGLVNRYVSEELNMPLHLPDDDLSGTFAFTRTLEDAQEINKVPLESYGENWLNYIIEEKTVFWWGGYGQSTEHTAYLNLKRGLKAPHSGSIESNGLAVAEQIGAQIFMDAFALMCPNDPQRARELVSASARVSHDGIAVEAACFLATLEALAFSIKDLDKLVDAAIDNTIWSEQLLKIIVSVREATRGVAKGEWNTVRDWLEEHYSYDFYSGNCHVVPNFALIMAALFLGRDSFRDTLEIVVSAGWDTDCNAANLGCIQGVRLGLEEINRQYDYRSPVNDSFYCITSLGGECVNDALLQTRKIVELHSKLYGKEAPEKLPHFAFELPGSTQGFSVCPFYKGGGKAPVNVGGGLLVEGVGNSISTLTMYDPNDRYGGYQLLGSPTLYSGQSVNIKVRGVAKEVAVVPYIIYWDRSDNLKDLVGKREQADKLGTTIKWEIPDLEGMAIARFGIKLLEGDGVILESVGWEGAPKEWALRGSLKNNLTNLPLMALQAFTSSARYLSFNRNHAMTVSHHEEGGIVDIGTSQWCDYKLSADVNFSLHQRGGLVVRSKGHRQYYALALEGRDTIKLLMVAGPKEKILYKGSFDYHLDTPLKLALACRGTTLSAYVNDDLVCQIEDSTYSCGGAGFLISTGTMLVKEMTIESLWDGPIP